MKLNKLNTVVALLFLFSITVNFVLYNKINLIKKLARTKISYLNNRILNNELEFGSLKARTAPIINRYKFINLVMSKIGENMSIGDKISVASAMYDSLMVCKNKELTLTEILSIMKVESGFNKNIISYKGAQGLMQLLPDTAIEVANINHINIPSDIKDPYFNTYVGVMYIDSLFSYWKSFGYTGVSLLIRSINSYNTGPNSELIKDKKRLMSYFYYKRVNKAMMDM